MEASASCILSLYAISKVRVTLTRSSALAYYRPKGGLIEKEEGGTPAPLFRVSAIAAAKRDGFLWNPIRRADPIRLRFTLARDPQRDHSKLRAWTSVWLIRSPRRWRADDEAGVA
jgi:hypothetical protein